LIFRNKTLILKIDDKKEADIMIKQAVFSLCILVMALGGCVSEPQAVPFAEEDITQSVTGDWESIILPDFILLNNVWGKGNIADFSQEMFTVSGPSGEGFGWRWDWPSSNRVLAYPEIMAGGNPWNPVYTAIFPRRVDDSPVVVTFSITENLSQHCNLALEFWITSDDTPSTDNITHEIMIWQINNGMMPDGTVRGRFEYNGSVYQVYVNKDQDPGMSSVTGWTYIAFVTSDKITSNELDLSLFTDFLIEEGYLEPDLYITGMELGTEICGGEGFIFFHEFSVETEPARY
jgi:hypothetical protein